MFSGVIFPRGEKMKIAIAQMKSYQGDIQRNVKKTIEYVDMAKRRGAEIVVFPELAIPGYLSMDLFQNPRFIEANKRGLEKVVNHTNGISTIVGFADSQGKRGPGGKPIVYNSAAIIQDGKIIDVQDKTLLPEYDIFDESRYFVSSQRSRVVEIGGKKIGVQICEDMWDEDYEKKVTDDLVKLGADMIVNLSASPFYEGKFSQRIKEIKRHNIPFVYANTVGVQDGYDGQVVFDGKSIATDLESRVIALGKAFEEDLIVFDVDAKNPEIKLRENEIEDLYNALVLGVKDYFEPFAEKKAIIGLSGGIDSALVAAIAKDALGKDRVRGIAMPSRYSSEHSLSDAKELAENLDISYYVAPIEKAHKAFSEIFADATGMQVSGIADENIQARSRGNINMTFSNQFNDFVLSTGNKTEMALGYCTLHGDMAGGLSPIADVDKLKVYELARYVNEKAGREIIPKNTIEKPPSAELAPGQEDEIGLGAPYEVLAPLVNEIVEDGASRDELIGRYDSNLVDDSLRRVYNNEFKRRQANPGIKVTKKSFGIGRRIPMLHGWR